MSWFEATVQSRREVASTVLLSLAVAAEVRRSFTAPGQYLHLEVGATRGPFAPASGPGGAGPLEVLLKPGAPLTDALAGLAPGARLRTSAFKGAGFPLRAAQGRPLLLVASGTGQAPMRSVIEAARRRRAELGPITLLLGVRDEAHLAFAAEQADWEREHIAVRPVLSRGSARWPGRVGRVQAHLPEGDLAGTVAFIAGQQAMVDEVSSALAGRGLPRAQIFLNL